MELQERKIVAGYYTNKLLEESRRVCKKNYRCMRKHFKETADHYAGLMKDVYPRLHP